MSKLLRWLKERLKSVRDRYYRWKYLFLGRLLGRTGIEEDLARRGLLIIQIDGLPYSLLRQAMDTGHLPFLKKTVDRGWLHLKEWFCGLPSNTPAVQGGMMHGFNDDIPGFRWYEKETGQYITFKSPRAAAMIEARVKEQGRPGLMTNGASYYTLLSGNASTTMFTMGTMLDWSPGRTLRGVQVLLLILLNFLAVLRVVWLTVRETLVEIWDWLNLLRRRVIQRSEYWFPLVRVSVNAWFREIISIGTMIEIARGTPEIWVSYCGFDECAHQRGPHSRLAMSCLRGIDRRIRKVVKLARRNILRQYDILIFSDHGSHPSIPFHYLYQETIDEYIARILEGKVTPDEIPDEEPRLSYTRLIAYRLERYERQFVRGFRWIVKRFRRWILLRSGEAEADFSPADHLVCANSSPLSNVYLPDKKKLADSEIQQQYPELIPRLVQHPGIGLVVTSEGDTAWIRSRHGQVRLGADHAHHNGEALKGYADQDLLQVQIRRQALMRNAGDLVLYGALHTGYAVNFEEQMSGHGGAGGKQTESFLLHSDGLAIDGRITDPRQLYPILTHGRTAPDYAQEAHTETGHPAV